MEWIKVFTSKWLMGSGRVMTAEKRGIWIDLLVLAGEAKLRDGSLRFDKGKPMSRHYISEILNLSEESLDSALVAFQSDINSDDGEARIKIWEDGTIVLTNFERYQATPNDKRKLTGRELELAQRMQLNKLAEKFPVEASNAPSVRKIIEASDDKEDKNTT